MGYTLMGRIHAAVITTLHELERREEGQGTVEYVGLLVLLGALFAGVVAAASSMKGGDIADVVVDQVKKAITTVSGGK